MPTDAWVQYGCFGLLAGLVVWTVWKGIPKALDMHIDAIREITTASERSMVIVCERFEKEQTSCRDERVALAIAANVDREKSRDALAKLNETTMRMVELIENRPG